MGIKVASRGLIDSYDYCVHFSSFHGKGANLWSMSDWVLGARLETLCLEAVFCFGVVSGLFFLTPYSFSESILVFLFLLAPQMQSCILVLPLQYPPCPPRPAPVLPSYPCAYTHTHILPHQVDLGHPGITDLPFFKFTILPNQCHAV